MATRNGTRNPKVISRSRSPEVHVPGWPPSEAALRECAERLKQISPCAECVSSLRSRRAGFCRSCVASLKLDSVLAVAAVSADAAAVASGAARPGKATGSSAAAGRGVGYGGAAGDERRVASMMEQQRLENAISVHRQISVLRELAKLLRPLTPEFFAALLFSVVPFLKQTLRFSWLEISDSGNRSLLEAALELCRSHVPGFADLLVCEFAISRNFQVVQEVSVAGEMRRVLETAQGGSMSGAAHSRVVSRLVDSLQETLEGVLHRARVRRLRGLSALQETKKGEQYEVFMKPLQVRWVSDFRSHKFAPNSNSNSTSAGGAVSGERMRRIRAEIMSLSSSLPLHKNASIFLLLNEARLDLMKVLIAGPVDTPYEFGLFEFHVMLPTEYPNRPPLVHFMTTGANTVRFGPNLYSCGKVCLSLLGTWQGPGWMPQQSTLLQLFVTIQSIILVAEPYFLEPGFENQPRTKASDDYNTNVLRNALKVAVEGIWKSPPEGFEEVAKLHFPFHKAAIDAKAKAANLPAVQW